MTLQAITRECLKLSGNGDCRFYDCLHARFPCGVSEVPANSSHAQCEVGKLKANTLDDEGKKWIYNIIRCIITMMTEIYKRPAFDCQLLVPVVLDIDAGCYLRNDFCMQGWSRRDALRSAFEDRMKNPGNYFYPLLWQNLQRIATTCLTRDSKRLITWMKRQFPTL
eukprot:XP_014780116.1 PREDICTED: uncharacterized protein LOC106876190 [Octopus bimaculoides]